MKEKAPSIKEYNDMIKNHIINRDFVKIKRTFKENEANISGFILGMSRDFLLVQKEEEFYLNGYAIFRKDNFDSLRCNSFDRTFKRILKSEGIFTKDYGLKNPINLKTWETIFTDLKKFDYHVIVECEDLDEPLFLIGPIKRVGKNAVGIQYYSPAGVLDKKPTTVKYKDITLVKFGDRYIDVFRKYLKKK